jgi:polyhydroxyalkanoate synthesis regulator phasin
MKKTMTLIVVAGLLATIASPAFAAGQMFNREQVRTSADECEGDAVRTRDQIREMAQEMVQEMAQTGEMTQEQARTAQGEAPDEALQQQLKKGAASEGAMTALMAGPGAEEFFEYCSRVANRFRKVFSII